jgi:hypothetical protein
MNLAEQRKMYLRDGKVWTVDDDPKSPLYRWVGGRGEAAGRTGLCRPRE